MAQRLFVYGTLAPGRSNSYLLERIGGTWQRATARGTLFPEGWGAVQGYPALVLDDEGEDVDGYVFTSESLSGHWPRLDAFEGDGYERVSTTVRLEDGGTVEAYVYVLNRRSTPSHSE